MLCYVHPYVYCAMDSLSGSDTLHYIHSVRTCVPTSTDLSLIISSFVTADVTPPRLVFLTSQRFSNENFTISWRFNEEATATCTLQTPTDQSTEICNNGVFMRTRLKGGLHFLFVQGTDLAGNTGRPMRYDWTVGEYNNTNKLVQYSSLPWTSSSNIYNN